MASAVLASVSMYVSRLSFSTLPGRGHDAAQALGTLASLVRKGDGAGNVRVLRTHFGSLGEADFELEQDFDNLSDFESSLHNISSDANFRTWSDEFSHLLARSPKREILEVL